ncbi:hypothetical protein HDU84_005978 [Entophlyctis sp. JEL0112]|nr:hypothetical protein HDU84_005978 [Entophlyctis sp. JEL0112]
MQQIHIVEEGVADFAWLVERLANNVGFSELDLSDSNIGSDGIIAISQALEVNQTLEKIDLSNSKFTSLAVIALADMICVNTTLRELRIASADMNFVDRNAEIALAEALDKNMRSCRIRASESITRNNARYHRQSSVASGRLAHISRQSIGRAFSTASSSLTQEEIDSIINEVTYEQKKGLAARIAELTEEQVEVIVEIIRSNVQDVPDDEFEIDIENLDNSTLWKLFEYVDSVKVEAPEWDSDEFESLQDETLEHSSLDVGWLVGQLSENAGIVSLQLNDAMLTADDILSVCRALAGNTVLEILNLEGNEITDESLTGIADLISKNKTLKELRISTPKTDLSTATNRLLAKAIAGNYSLKSFSLPLMDLESELIISKSLERNNSTDMMKVPFTEPVVSSNVKNLAWKFETAELSDSSERRKTKVSVIKTESGAKLVETKLFDSNHRGNLPIGKRGTPQVQKTVWKKESKKMPSVPSLDDLVRTANDSRENTDVIEAGNGSTSDFPHLLLTLFFCSASDPVESQSEQFNILTAPPNSESLISSQAIEPLHFANVSTAESPKTGVQLPPDTFGTLASSDDIHELWDDDHAGDHLLPVEKGVWIKIVDLVHSVQNVVREYSNARFFLLLLAGSISAMLLPYQLLLFVPVVALLSLYPNK